MDFAGDLFLPLPSDSLRNRGSPPLHPRASNYELKPPVHIPPPGGGASAHTGAKRAKSDPVYRRSAGGSPRESADYYLLLCPGRGLSGKQSFEADGISVS